MDYEKHRANIERRIAEIHAEQAKETDEADPVSPDASIGRLSRLDSMQMQQMALAAKQRRTEELGRLRDALNRVDARTYGLCAFCRRPIHEERLLYQPDAALCIDCAR